MYKKDILIADDDNNLLEIYEIILSEKSNSDEGFPVKTFSDGKFLWEYFKFCWEEGKKIPLSILDMKMPFMDGLETAKKLREIDEDIIIIIVTALEDLSFDTVRKSLEKDIYYVKKPFNKEELYCLADSLIKVWNKNFQLKEYQKELEKLVEKRTSEIKKKNFQLIQEINERYRIESTLRESEEWLTTLVEGSKDAIISINSLGLITIFNSAAEEMFLRKKEDMLGSSLDILMPEKYRRNHEGNIKKYFATGKSHNAIGKTLELPAVRNNGERFPIELSLSAGKYGEEKFVLAIIRDITERKEAEKALKASENIYRKLYEEHNILLETIPAMIFVLSKDMKILWANSKARERFGTEICSDKKCYEICFKTDKVCDNCIMIKSFERKEPVVEQVVMPDKRVFDIKVTPVEDDKGKIAKSIVIINDITEKINLQKEALRTSHLASLGELAAGVAHEINNPINGIINYGQILLDTSNNASGEHAIAERIIKESERIDCIVSSLLTFSRNDTSEKSSFSIKKILSDCLSLIGTQLLKSDIKVINEIPEKFPFLTLQANQIQQVFLNILSNAKYALNKKYAGPHKKKVIEVLGEEIEVSGKKYGKIIFLDYGCGIPEDLLNKIINPFFTTKPLGRGTGLGLSISYGIINDHGGIFEIDSKEGEFTKISISLPL